MYAEIIAEIADGLGKHFLRCAHPPQNGGGKQNTQNGQQDSCSKAKGHIGMDGFSHGGIILCAIVPGDDHTCAHGNTVEKADHHENQTAGRADSRQGGVAEKTPHNPGVKGVVKLLKHIAQKYRKGKQQHDFPDRPLGQRMLLVIQEKHFLF